jgi:hypothetical protein
MLKLYTSLLLALLVSVYHQVQAQETKSVNAATAGSKPSLIRFGFPLHIGAAFVVPSPTQEVAEGIGPGASFRFGSALQIWPSRFIGPSFGLGFNLIHLRARQAETFFQPEIIANARLFFFNLPVGFTLRTNPDKKVRFFFAAHYENQFVLSSTTKVTARSDSESVSEVVDDTQDYHTNGNFYYGALRFNLGADIQVSPRVSLVVGPYVVVEDIVTPAGIKGIETASDRSPYTMAAGLNFGVMLDCRPKAR